MCSNKNRLKPQPFLLLFSILFYNSAKSFSSNFDSPPPASTPCQKRSFDRDSFVCVCSATSCDSPAPLGEIGDGQLVYYVSDKSQYRLERFSLDKTIEEEGATEKTTATSAAINKNKFEVRVNASQQFQRIFGFGGAFTDAAGINLNALSAVARQTLIEQYFSTEKGIGYSVGRVPIASCDFSTREYSYLDTPDVFDVSSFELAPEDAEAKIPHILTATNLTGGLLKLFASPWSAPGWMKTSGRMKGPGQLKGTFNGRYYETYALYLRRFFEEYAAKGVPFWGMTIENEPSAGVVPFYGWQAMYFSSQMQRDFASQLLLPTLQGSQVTKNLKIIAHDDMRNAILSAAKKIYEDPEKAKAIDGLGSHWYSRSGYEVLSQAHFVRPDKFILATEACNGYLPWEHRPWLGDWSRGQSYGHDILNNLRNWAVGWIDWNICVDLQGGPNWVRNFVDAPIVVNASADEFYKQPMFYFLAHFSRFVPRDSLVISSSFYSTKCRKDLFSIFFNDRLNCETVLEEKVDDGIGVNEDSLAGSQQIEHVAFRTPNGNRVLVLLNSNQATPGVNVTITEAGKSWTIPLGPASIVTAVWKKTSGE